MRRRVLAVVAASLLAGSAVAASTPAPRVVERLADPAVGDVAAQRWLDVPVEADASLDRSAPTAAAGTGISITLSPVPARDLLLRADLTALADGVPATLRLHPDPPLPAGTAIEFDMAWLSGTAWDEALVTASTSPVVDGAFRRVRGSVGPDGWLALDVRGAVASGARVTLLLRAIGSPLTVDARESGAGAVLTVGLGVDPADLDGAVRVWAVGDLACPGRDAVTADSCHQWAVSNLLAADPAAEAFVALGDLQYPAGALADLLTGYDPSYGRLLAMTLPTPGNHEYGTAGAAGYRSYFGSRAHPESGGWYSVDLGASWHLVVLDSNCAAVGCAVGSAQEQWLRADLAGSTRPCTIGVWHHPRFSSGEHHGIDDDVRPLWEALADDHAEILLAGHDHVYERFHRQTVDGVLDASGIRQFTVGTGGRSLYEFGTPLPSSSVRLSTFGALRLDLDATGYRWAFVDETGIVLDSGSGVCV